MGLGGGRTQRRPTREEGWDWGGGRTMREEGWDWVGVEHKEDLHGRRGGGRTMREAGWDWVGVEQKEDLHGRRGGTGVGVELCGRRGGTGMGVEQKEDLHGRRGGTGVGVEHKEDLYGRRGGTQRRPIWGGTGVGGRKNTEDRIEENKRRRGAIETQLRGED